MGEQLVGVCEMRLLEQICSLATLLWRRVPSGHNQTLHREMTVEQRDSEKLRIACAAEPLCTIIINSSWFLLNDDIQRSIQRYLKVFSLLKSGPCRLCESATRSGELLIELLQLLLLITHLEKSWKDLTRFQVM